MPDPYGPPDDRSGRRRAMSRREQWRYYARTGRGRPPRMNDGLLPVWPLALFVLLPVFALAGWRLHLPFGTAWIVALVLDGILWAVVTTLVVRRAIRRRRPIRGRDPLD